eukprot:231809_1
MAMLVCYDTGTKKGKVMKNWRPDGAPTLNALRIFIKRKYKKYKLKWFELQYKYDDEQDAMCDIDEPQDLTDAIEKKRKSKQDFIIYVSKIVDEDEIKELEEEEKIRQEQERNLREEYDRKSKLEETKQIEKEKQQSSSISNDDEKKEKKQTKQNKASKPKVEIKNPLIVNIGISEYQSKELPKLLGCRKNVDIMNNIFVNEYKYDSKMIMHNNDKDKYGLTKSEILDTITRARDTIKKSPNVDALIISLSGHGSVHTIYGADYDGKDAGKIDVTDIDKIFDEKDEEFNFADIPKIMIMDSYHKQTVNDSITEPSLTNINWLCFYSSSHGYNSSAFDHNDGGFLITAVATVLKDPLCYQEDTGKKKLQYTLQKLKTKITTTAFKLTRDENMKKKIKAKQFKAKMIVTIQDTMDKNVQVTFNKADVILYEYLNESLITQIDKALSGYYQSLNEDYDELFQNYCEENGFDTDAVLEDLDKDPVNSLLVDFDDNFPFITDPESREKTIFEVILKCKNNPKIRFDVPMSSENVTLHEKLDFPLSVKSNALIISIVIKEYDKDNKYRVETLKGVEQDISNYQNILVDKFGYTLISNIDKTYNNKYGTRMTKSEVEKFLREARIRLIDMRTGTVYYDSLIVTIGAHGVAEGIVCSNGELFNYNELRDLFLCDTNLIKIPRIYLIDSCRSNIEPKNEEKKQEDEQRNNSVRGSEGTNSITIFGTSRGNRVKGAKLSVYFCKSMHQNFKSNETVNDYKKWNTFYRTCRHMNEMIKENTKNDLKQAIDIDAHALEVDDIVFMPKCIDDMERGSKYDHDYLDETWNIIITNNGISKTYIDTKIKLDFKAKAVVFKYDDNKQTETIKKKTFTIGQDEGNVYIRFISNDNTIQIECNDVKAAKYWFQKINPLSG